MGQECSLVIEPWPSMFEVQRLITDKQWRQNKTGKFVTVAYSKFLGLDFKKTIRTEKKETGI